MPAGKSVLLIISGVLAAFKSLELLRLLNKQGVSCRVILPNAGEPIATPLYLPSLSGEKTSTPHFSPTPDVQIGPP